MIDPKIIKMKGFWKSVFQISVVFIIVMLIFRIGLVYELDFSRFVETDLSPDRIFMFVVSNVLVWIVVGFVLAYFNFKKKTKEK